MSKPTVTHPQGAVAGDAAGILADLRELIHSVAQAINGMSGRITAHGKVRS